ncbi:phenylalanine--tRNA ligase subunit beta [Candidatus Saccharibacteria bacterium]|nr:phenylalanine--tRNA ligase subunit beta [Candidatus Saccharibacteria bacterium]
MKVSLNQIKQFIDFDLPSTDELVQRINGQLGGVEDVIYLGDKYKDARIVHVVECEKHPNADRLNVCKIDAGTGELIQVVCGAPNVQADMWAVWLPPGSVVPATYGDAEPFTLGARELRGVMSNGMLAAGDELALNDDHDGIIVVTEADLPEGAILQPGASFAEIFGLDDTIIDIENKMFTHRPDCFGQLGVAREISAILQGVTAKEEGATDTRFENPDWYWNQPEFAEGTGSLELEVQNNVIEKVPRFMAVAMSDVTVRQSPLWLQCALMAMGAKPINNVVDLTNYSMLITGQPTHAYDYDKLRGHTLIARMATQGERAALLNGKTYELSEDDIVIADSEGVVGIGGIMGGSNSEVSAETKSIVLEAATFDMYTVRKTSMRHGLFTDALTRFNKGQSKLQNDRVLARLMSLLENIVGATQASKMHDISDMNDERDNTTLSGEVAVAATFINDRLGVDLSTDQMGNLLRRVNFASYPAEGDSSITMYVAPFWRTDIELAEDVVEEVGRLYGFDKLPRELPYRRVTPAVQDGAITAKERIRTVLARAGANEVLTYSFVHANVLEKVGQDSTQAYQLSNALSPDLQYYRLSLLPSLLDKVHMNDKAGYDEFMLFEIGKAHHVDARDDDGLPQEFGRVAGVYAARADLNGTGPAYYQSRHTLDYLVRQLLPGATVSYIRLDEYTVPTYKPFEQLLAPFDPVRTAIVEVDGKLAGVVGELRAKVGRNFKLPERVSAFELFVSPFVQHRTTMYKPLSKYQGLQRDICFQVDVATRYEDIYRAAAFVSDDIRVTSKPLDIYQSDGGATKNVTLRFEISPNEKTLNATEVSQVIDTIIENVVHATGAQVV